ncbi:UNC-50-like protein [Mucor mucedo]|uniref:UNC-50-like protein n=1 Tax=Mucor mucedo TaxID=29922 RepID=UPI00221E9C6C|nr:UNC-50-like protein [Mucor mucedo]KAI7895807.1 UNC-50-like protein [Mucor mucedo]
MELLPTNNNNSDGTRRFKRASSMPLILTRLVRFPQLDFEFALWQMAYLVIAPRRVYRNIYYHKQTKNQWARDDPAFLVLLASLLCVSALAWGVVFGLGMVGILRAMLFMVVVDFVLVGSLVATLTWFITNRFLCQQGKMMTQDSQVEWAYAFDIHCNSFFPLFLILYIVQFFFLPVLIKSNLVCLVAANILYLVSVAWYCYGTFLGFNVLPFLVHTELLLYPIIGFVVGFILLSVFRVNLCENVIGFYFGWS